MIIWINGAFGSGKTQTAYELKKRLENAHVFDPEEAGFYIRENLPKEVMMGDFQDYEMWRDFNYSMLKYIKSGYKGIVICPMTITDKRYKEAIIDRLEADGVEIRHFTLQVTRETLEKRLRGRGEKKNSWCFEQIERCTKNLSENVFNDHIITDEMSINDVVEEIASRCNLRLKDDKRGKIQKRWDRLVIWKKHIRIFG